MVQNIKTGVKEGRYQFKEISKDINTCKEYFCKLKKYEIRDEQGRLRSCGETNRQEYNLTSVIEFYFSISGIARFSFETNVSYKSKIIHEYWDESGIQIWMINEQKNGRFEYGEDFRVVDQIPRSSGAFTGPLLLDKLTYTNWI